MNPNKTRQPPSNLGSLIRKSVFALITAAILIPTHHTYARDDVKPSIWTPATCDPGAYDPRHRGGSCAAPEVATWCIGAGLLGLMTAGLIYRKTAAGKQAPAA